MIQRWHTRERARLRQALNHPAPSAWENLGLWSRPDQPYAEAARALAMRVGGAARLQRGDRVLDIGPGVGQDQANLWHHQFAIGERYGWERDTPSPPDTQWQHVLAVDSAYFVPDLWQRWQTLWPSVTPGGTITWTDLYLNTSSFSWRAAARLRATSALAAIPFEHWCSADDWLARLHQLPHARARFDDLSDEVLGGFVRHMNWRRTYGWPGTGLHLAYGTAALLKPLLNAQIIGYGLFQVVREDPTS